MRLGSKQRIGMLLLGAALVLAALLAARLDNAGASKGRAITASTIPGLSAKTLATLRLRAIYSAADMGEKHPTNGVIVSTTQHAFFGAQPGGESIGTPDFPVYVVAYRGKMTAYGASTPAGVQPPTGSSAYFVYNAKTLDISDWGIGESPANLSGLGPSMRLDLSS